MRSSSTRTARACGSRYAAIQRSHLVVRPSRRTPVSKEILGGREGCVEKEKGIEPGTLLAAIEDALLAAYRKMPDARHPVRVDLDRESGDFTVWSVHPEAWEAYLEAHPHHRPPEVAAGRRAGRAAGRGRAAARSEPEPEIEWDWFSRRHAGRRHARELQPHRRPDRQAGAAPAHQRGRALDDVRRVRRPRGRDRDRHRPAGRPPLRVRRPRPDGGDPARLGEGAGRALRAGQPHQGRHHRGAHARARARRSCCRAAPTISSASCSSWRCRRSPTAS